jgi:Uma2 family endonuclease
MYQNHRIDPLPTMYDLPSEDKEEMGLPDEFHDFQPKLLRETCQPLVDEFFVGADLNLYYDVRHTNWYKRPDWFLVLGAPASQSQDELRWSYLIWREGVAPFLVVELLSPGTEDEDLGQTLRVVGKPPTKWQVYEQILRVNFYALYDRYSKQFRLFELRGNGYVELTIDGQGFWFEALQLGLGLWNGSYFGVEGQWLRWYDRSGNWVGTDREQLLQAQQEVAIAQQEAVIAQQEVEIAKQQKEDAEQRAARLAARLRELGIDPE